MYVCHTNQIGFTRNSLSIVFVARKCNKIFSFVSFKWKLDTFVSHVRVVAIKTDESVTLVHMVRLNNQEVNLAARPKKCLDLCFLGSVGLCSKNRVLCFRASPMKLGYYAQNYAQLEV